MKKLIKWFLGETATRVLTAWWRWFWTQSIYQGNQLTLEAAKDSLESMQESVDKLTSSVAKVSAVYQQAQRKYTGQQAEYNKANEQATLALEQENEQAARLAIARAITLEKALPNLKAMADQSQQMLEAAKQELQVEQEKLEACRFEMGNLEAIAEMNEALSSVMDLTGKNGINSAKAQFKSAENAITNKNLEVTAQRELSQNPAEKLARELDGLSQSEAIEKRLKQLKHKQTSNLTVITDVMQGNAHSRPS